jgi:membrane protein
VSKAKTVPDEPSVESGPAEATESEPSRWRTYVSTLRERAQEAKEEAEAKRDDSKLYDAAFRVYERNRVLPLSLLVGALASRIVIYIIPLFALLVFGLGWYEDSGGSGTETANNITAVFASAVEESAEISNGFRFFALVATIFAVLYAANSLGRLVRRCFSLVWGIPYQSSEKPWMPAAGVLGISAVGWIVTNLAGWSRELSWQAVVGFVVFEFIGLTALWLVVSRKLPHDPAANRWSDFLPGAAFLSVGVVGLRLAMVIYFVPQSADLADRYGSIGVALVMLTWAYWLGMIIVGGAELNVALLRSQARAPTAG